MEPKHYRKALAKRGKVKQSGYSQPAHCACKGRLVVHAHKCENLQRADLEEAKARVTLKALRLIQEAQK